MKHHIKNRMYHVEILPPKQDTEHLEADLAAFVEKYLKIIEGGYCACITDNAMGRLSFQGPEVIEEMGLPTDPEQVMIHLNTFHTKQDLDNILGSCRAMGIRYLLIVSGDGSERLPKLQPQDINADKSVKSVTSVELLRYIKNKYPGVFVLGAAFNPYEPKEHEFEKLQRKFDAGAEFIVTQPIIKKNEVIDLLLEKYPEVPVFFEAWMSKKISLLSEAVGYEVEAGEQFDPVETLKELHATYPACGMYLSLLGFKTQFGLIKDIWN